MYRSLDSLPSGVVSLNAPDAPLKLLMPERFAGLSQDPQWFACCLGIGRHLVDIARHEDNPPGNLDARGGENEFMVTGYDLPHEFESLRATLGEKIVVKANLQDVSRERRWDGRFVRATLGSQFETMHELADVEQGLKGIRIGDVVLHFVQPYALLRRGPQQWLFMEYAPGESLWDLDDIGGRSFHTIRTPGFVVENHPLLRPILESAALPNEKIENSIGLADMDLFEKGLIAALATISMRPQEWFASRLDITATNIFHQPGTGVYTFIDMQRPPSSGLRVAGVPLYPQW